MKALLAALMLAAGGPARAQERPAKLAPARLINLLEADLDAQPELRPFAAGLAATFQILTRRQPKPGTTDARARAPEDEGGQGLMAECSGSFLPGGRVVTAQHCLWRDREQLSQRLVLRRHLFRLEGGRLIRAGFQDFAITGKMLASQGDLAVLELAGPPPSPAPGTFTAPGPAFDYRPGTVFYALGYPSQAYGVPYLSFGCRIAGGKEDALAGDSYEANCPAEGGMSGGPQFLGKGGVQIGIVSITQGSGDKASSTSPRLPSR